MENPSNNQIMATDIIYPPESYTIDWGSRDRKQGKRSGGMVTGAMGVALQGEKTYSNVFANLPDYHHHKDELKMMPQIQREFYLKARSAGLSHNQAMLRVYEVYE